MTAVEAPTPKKLTRQQEVKIELDEGNRRLRQLAREKAELRTRMDALVIEGDKLGVPKLTLSQLSGLTRQTIYAILLRDQAARKR